METAEEDSALKALIELVPQFGNSYVHIKHPKSVLTLLNKVVLGGSKSLQVIADFDHTITKQHINGERHVSSFCVIGNCSTIPSGFREQDRELLQKYLPIERDPHLTKEEKTPYMVEWYSKTSEVFSGFPLDSNEINNAVKGSHTELRTGTQELVKVLDAENIPMLVFSAGLGDVVESILKEHDVVNKNIHVISNFLQFKDGCVNGFTADMVHPFNKNGKAAAHTKYFDLMASRHNVLLMGDNLGDADMADGVPNTDAVLKIGFLFGNNVNLLLPQYMDHFDVVLIDDQTMDVANSIIRLLIEKNSTNETLKH